MLSFGQWYGNKSGKSTVLQVGVFFKMYSCSRYKFIYEVFLLVFNRFYLGRAPFLLIFDLDILKQVLVKEFDSFMDRPVNTLLLCMICALSSAWSDCCSVIVLLYIQFGVRLLSCFCLYL